MKMMNTAKLHCNNFSIQSMRLVSQNIFLKAVPFLKLFPTVPHKPIPYLEFQGSHRLSPLSGCVEGNVTVYNGKFKSKSRFSCTKLCSYRFLFYPQFQEVLRESCERIGDLIVSYLLYFSPNRDLNIFFKIALFNFKKPSLPLYNLL